jgi:DNA-binding FadR family transcriptional regulator
MENLERTKLIAHIENELERMVARGAHPQTGILPSERKLARSFGVARGTIREALLRLSARGLVVRRQGTQARAVALGRAVTLENLGVVLHELARGRSGELRLLEGYFELKRETTVELLVRGCEHASTEELARIETACFELREGARWDDGSNRWVEQEFELLRTAALAAERPGHFLLVQSLERAFWGMAEVVRPLLPSEAVRHWSERAQSWLFDRDGESLRRELPPLLLACDAHVLGRLGPASRADAVSHPTG